MKNNKHFAQFFGFLTLFFSCGPLNALEVLHSNLSGFDGSIRRYIRPRKQIFGLTEDVFVKRQKISIEGIPDGAVFFSSIANNEKTSHSIDFLKVSGRTDPEYNPPKFEINEAWRFSKGINF